MGAKASGMYDEETFDKSVLPSFLKRETQDCIQVAVMLGWKMHLSTGGSVTIVSPCERKRHHFSASGRSSTSLNRVRRDLVRFADPEKLLIADSLIGMGLKPGPESVLLNAALPEIGDEGTIVDHRPEQEEEARRERERKAQAAEERERQKAAEPQLSSRQIVSQKPMLAKAQEGKGYESLTTIERIWSDGKKDYRCSFQGCLFISDNRGSVPSHYAKAHGAVYGEGEKRNIFKAEVPEAQTYAPRKRRIDALAAVIRELWDVGAQPEEMARAALTWVHEQSKKGTEFASEREPMTAEDTLQRIRNLLDDGAQFEMRQQMEKMEERLVEAETRAQVAEKRAEQARSTLKAFMELARDFTDEEQTA